jgi:hypothetical protein
VKIILTSAICISLLSGCAATGPQTVWGKPGVTRETYVNDLGTCMAMAGMTPVANGANTAGGMNGSNPEAPAGNNSDYGRNQGGFGVPQGGAVVVGGGGVYRDSAPIDVVNRAATQEQTQSMAAKRVATDTYRSCYSQRGYQEFKLTPEQRRHLGTLESGSNEFLQYIADIGTDPAKLGSPVDH